MTRIDVTDKDEIYDRLLNDKPYGKNLKPYSVKVLNKVINEFIQSEEYEKCSFIKKIMKERFING